MKKRPNGFVLVTVLWVVALLAVITISYHHRARLELRAARYSLDTAQARMSARAALERGLVALRNKALWAQIAQDPSQPAPPYTHYGQEWAQSRDLYSAVGYLRPGPGFEHDVAQYHITDLEGRFNLNEIDEDVLASLPGMSRPVARRIHYRRNGDIDAGVTPQSFQHVSELRQIRGIDDAAWRGGQDESGLRDVLTTYGDGLININTAPAAVLSALPDVDQGTASDLVQLRNGPDGVSQTTDDLGFSDWETFRDATQISGHTLASFQRFCKFNSNYFKISAMATRRGGMIRSQCTAIVYVPDGSNVASLLSWSEESLGAP